MDRDHLEILLEDIRGKFDLVLEGHEGLRGDIERARQESKERDEHLLFLIQTVNGKVDGVEARLGARLDRVETRLDSVETRLDRVETRLDRVETRLDRVETRLGSVESKVDTLASELAAHRRDTEAHRGVYRVQEPG